MTGLRSTKGNPAAPPYKNGPYTWGQHVTFSQGVGGVGIAVPEGSNIWYVDKNRSSSGKGSSWGEAFLTLTEAVAVAGAYDTIIMGRGYYQEAATIEITSTQRGLKIFGPTTGGVATSNGLSSATSGADILYINADDVEIAGITFWCLTNGKNGITVGEDYDGYNNWIHDCCFITGTAGNTLGEYGIKANANDDCVGLLIENNYFHYLSTAAIAVHATRATVRNNIIWSSSIGIDVQNTGASRACCIVADNYIVGMNLGTGIKLASTEATDGNILLVNNAITNFTTNITSAKSVLSQVNNQTAADATSYLQVDASP